MTAADTGQGPNRILVAEDEADLRDLLRIGLEREGFTVYEAADGEQALSLLSRQAVDLGVFDIMMPRMDGITLLQRVREQHQFPVLFLSARGEEFDKVLGLGMGADDYLVKPFSMAELVARIRAQLRRVQHYTANPNAQKRVRFGRVCVDRSACQVEKDGAVQTLNAKEYRLLECFLDHEGQVLTRKQLYRLVWGEDAYEDDNTVMVHMSRLRAKIEDDPRAPRHLKTVRGLGYLFRGEDPS